MPPKTHPRQETPSTSGRTAPSAVIGQNIKVGSGDETFKCLLLWRIAGEEATGNKANTSTKDWSADALLSRIQSVAAKATEAIKSSPNASNLAGFKIRHVTINGIQGIEKIFGELTPKELDGVDNLQYQAILFEGSIAQLHLLTKQLGLKNRSTKIASHAKSVIAKIDAELTKGIAGAKVLPVPFWNKTRIRGGGVFGYPTN